MHDQVAQGFLSRRLSGVLCAALAGFSACGGESAPETTLLDLPQLQARVAAPRSHPLLLVFWATWCEPCVAEMPDLAALHGRQAGALDILGVSLDAFLHPAEKSLSLVTELLTCTPMPYENVVFVGKQDELFAAFDLPGGIPYAVLYDGKGRELRRFAGNVEPAVVEELLAGAAASEAR